MFQKLFILCFTVLFIFVCKLDAQLERACITPNNENANCTSVFKCQVFLDILKSSTESQRKFMKESLCGHYRNLPIVCCGSDTDYVKQATRPKRELTRNPAIPETECGQSLSDSGSPGGHDFPWAVRMASNKSLHYLCDGTLISRRYVLTAGICVDPETFKQTGNLVKIRLGEQNCPDGGNKCDKKNIIDVGVEQVILHEAYGSTKSLNHDDIGLIRLDRDVTFNDDVKPVCLPKPNEVAKPGDKVVEAGWYRNNDNKLQAVLTVVSKEECSKSYKPFNLDFSETHMCAGGYPDNICPVVGSAGGSLNRKLDNSWMLEGIVSFGPGNCNDAIPTVFTKVEPYLQWIHANVKN